MRRLSLYPHTLHLLQRSQNHLFSSNGSISMQNSWYASLQLIHVIICDKNIKIKIRQRVNNRETDGCRGKLNASTFSFYSYKKYTTNFTFYYTYLSTMQYYRDDAKGSEGQRLPESLNIKTRNYASILISQKIALSNSNGGQKCLAALSTNLYNKNMSKKWFSLGCFGGKIIVNSPTVCLRVKWNVLFDKLTKAPNKIE